MKPRAKELFDKYYNKTATEAERAELWALLSGLSNDDLHAWIREAGEGLAELEEIIPEDRVNELIGSILRKNPVENPIIETTPVRKINWLRWVAAASILIALSLGGYFLLGPKSVPVITQTIAHDVKAPVTNRATLVLQDGSTIDLDSINKGQIALQNNVQVVKLDNGQIAYKGSSAKILYNTVNNPRGSMPINIMLSDGSRVWLNAGSSVTYPVAFVGNTREVSMDGEAYFEVYHDVTKPFKVNKGDVAVTVLGTHFNVNAYSDEPDIKITLLEGAVKVNKGNNSQFLKPGQQAQVAEKVSVLNNADIDIVMAWKNGFFSFNNSDVQTVMRQLARWYDVEVSYEGVVTKDQFTGAIDRNIKLSKVLDNLAKARIHFRIDGKRLTITP